MFSLKFLPAHHSPQLQDDTFALQLNCILFVFISISLFPALLEIQDTLQVRHSDERTKPRRKLKQAFISVARSSASDGWMRGTDKIYELFPFE